MTRIIIGCVLFSALLAMALAGGYLIRRLVAGKWRVRPLLTFGTGGLLGGLGSYGWTHWHAGHAQPWQALAFAVLFVMIGVGAESGPNLMRRRGGT